VTASRPSGPGSEFEAAFEELAEVVERLESGELGLDESIRLFERGRELVDLCERIIDEAKQRVTRLAPESAALEP
jgi:exodeoxyribonuclease VII small subunit